MKKSLILQLWIVTVLLSNAFAQEHTWPIARQDVGQGILFRPQDYIGEELNYDALFVTAPYGTNVVSPVTGKISHLFYVYSDNLDYVHSYSTDSKPDELRRIEIKKSIQEKHKKNVDSKFISISIGIISSDGSKYSISGLRPVVGLKTGMQIKQGEQIGTVGYTYKAIKQPSIAISRSTGGRVADPMSTFGLKSTFIAPKVKTNDPKKQFTKEQLEEDFLIFRESLEEGHPGLYDYTSKQEMDSLFDIVYSKIKGGATAYEFYELIIPIVKYVHDSHTYLSMVANPNKNEDKKTTPITFGLFGDSLVVTRTDKANVEFVGKKISAIDGIKSDKLITEIRSKIKNRVSYHEGTIESIRAVHLSLFFWLEYLEIYNIKKEGITFTFEDGKTKSFPIVNPANKSCVLLYPVINYRTIPQQSILYKRIDKNTALIDINTFELSEVDNDSIKIFINDISGNGYKNLIIDLRNNRGGNFGDLYKYFAEKPFQTVVGLKVNQIDTYNFFKYCKNFTADDRQLFSDYKKVDGKDGYYYPVDSMKFDYPCDSIHFAGRVYVLANELSISAASIFAGLVHKYKRGVIVGRETGSAYQQLNAVKFANVNLKNTGLSLRIPLVKCIYEYPEDSDIPWGRGVLPDYPFDITLEELIGDKDTMLNYTLQLIKEDKYLNEEVNFQEFISKKGSNNNLLYLIISFGVIACAIIIISLKKKSNQKSKS